MTAAKAKQQRLGLHDRWIVPVLIALLVLTVLGVLYLTAFLLDNNRRQTQTEFANQTTSLVNAMQSRVSLYSNLLYSIEGGLSTKRTPLTRDQYHQLSGYLDIKDRYPGLSSVTYTQHVPAENRDAYIQSVRQDTSLTPGGYPGFTIKPAGIRPDGYVVTFIEPLNPSSPGFGLDISTDPQRYAAIQKARDTGELQSTTPTKIISADKSANIRGFIVFAPIYESATPHANVEQRRENIAGVLNAVFRADNLFEGVVRQAGTANSVQLAVYDSDTPGADGVLYSTFKHDTSVPSGYLSKTTDLKFGGKTWKLLMSAPPSVGLSSLDQQAPVFALIMGLLVSMLLGTMLWVLAMARARAVHLAEEITADLKESEAQYRGITQNSQELIGLVELDGTIRFASPASEGLLGYKSDELIGRKAVELSAPDDVKKVASALDGLVKGVSDRLMLEYRMKTKKGSVVWVESLWQVITYEGFKVLQVSSRDVTERKKIEEDLRAQTAELERLNNVMIGRELKMIELKKKLSPRGKANE